MLPNNDDDDDDDDVYTNKKITNIPITIPIHIPSIPTFILELFLFIFIY